MKAIIMAGGKGTRMLPYTEHTNKVLLPVNGKPFLHWLLIRLQKAGYKEFGVIVSYKKEQVEKFLNDNGWNATAILQPEPLGTGHAVQCAKSFAGNEQFIVVGGDNLWSVEDLAAVRRDDQFTYIVGKRHEHPERYGVLHEKDGFLLDIVEKPKVFVGDLINTGLYKFTSEIFEELDKVRPQPNGEVYLTDAVTALAKHKKVKVLPLKGDWLDFGRPDDLSLVENYLKKNTV